MVILPYNPSPVISVSSCASREADGFRYKWDTGTGFCHVDHLNIIRLSSLLLLLQIHSLFLAQTLKQNHCH